MPVGAAQIGSERRLTVGSRRHQVESAARAEEAGAEPGHHVAALLLEWHRWHRHEDVVRQKGHRCVEIGGLLDGEILVYASYALERTLIEHDLVDGLRLVVFPVLGAGERLFGETSDKKPMRLVDAKTIGDGLAFLTYELVRDARQPSGGVGRRETPLGKRPPWAQCP